MNEVERLEHLSLVSKICTELENHLGLNDKDLAELIIYLAEKNDSFITFKNDLVENGAEFSDFFIEHLLRIIQHMKPKQQKESSSRSQNEKDRLAEMLPFLAIPNDSKWHAHNAEKGKKEEKKSAQDDIVSDAMPDLEDLVSTQISTSRIKLEPSSPSGSKCETSVPVGTEMWEVKQMLSAACVDRSELPYFDDETGLLPKEEDEEEDIEIEMVECEPPFMQGYRHMLRALSPVRIIKNPDGPLAQIAMMENALAKEPRVLKMLRHEQQMDFGLIHYPKMMAEPCSLAEGDETHSREHVHRISSPEKWEVEGMLTAACIDKSELPDFDDETGLLPKEEDEEEDIEIEMVEYEPPFLQGYRHMLRDLSPVRTSRTQMALWHRQL
jgi:ATP-dependent RNA helicase DHX8/PRP22